MRGTPSRVPLIVLSQVCSRVGDVVLSLRSHQLIQASVFVAASLLFAACGSATVTPSQTGSATIPSTSPAPNVTSGPGGFAFAAGDIVAYYQGQGYDCAARQPSTKVLGFFFRTCTKVDDAGRKRVIGVVTDPGGNLVDGFASVQGTAGETFLAPVDALEPLGGFLGATLGQDQGAAALPWLAGHLGDAYSDTKMGAITMATYTNAKDDHSKMYVEVANKTYLDAAAVGTP